MAFDGQLKFDTSIDQTGFQSGLSGLGDLAKSGLSGLGDIAKASMAAVTNAVSAVSGAVLGIGKNAIAVGKEFEAGMSQVQATLGITVDDLKNNINGAADTMEALTAKAEEMGATTKYTASQAAEGLNILAMSGYDAEASISMLDSTLSLAAAGGLQLASAAQYITGSMKGFADEAERFKDETEASTYYADMIAKGATLAATNVDQLGEAMSGAAAIANSYGQTSQSTEVALLRLAEQGEVGSAAATYLAAAMANIYTPMDQAKAAMDALGVSAYDEAGNMRDFNDVVDDLHAALDALGNPQKATDLENVIFGLQGKKAFDKMVVSSRDKVQEFYAGLAYTEDGAMGSAAAQAEAMMDNLQGDIQLFESSVDGLYNSLYKSMNGTLRELVKLGNGYITALDDAFKTGGFDGAAEKLGSVLSDAFDHIDDYLPDAIGIGNSIVSSLIDGISGNSGSIIETGLDMGLKMLSGFGDITVNFLDLGANLMSSLATGIENKLPKISGMSREILIRIIKAVGENLPVMLESGADIVEMLAGAIAGNLDRLTVFGNWTVRQITKAIRDSLPDILQAGSDLIGAFGNSILDSLPVLLDCAVQIMQTLVNVIADPDDLSALISAGITIVQTLGGALLDNLQPLLDAGMQVIGALIGVLSEPDAVAGLLQAGIGIIDGLVNAITQNAAPLAGAAVQIITVLGTALIGNIPLLLGAAFDIANALIQALADPETLTGLLDAALNMVTTLGTLLVENLSPLLGAVIQMIAVLGQWIGEHALDLVSAGLVIVNALVDALIDNLPLLLDAAVQIVEGLAKGIEDDSADVLVAIEQIIRKLLDFLLAPDTLGKIGETGGKIIRALIPAAAELAGDLLGFAMQLLPELDKALKKIKWGEAGKNIVAGIFAGMLGVELDYDEFFNNFGENWLEGFGEIWDNTVQGFKDFWNDILAIDWVGLGKDILSGIVNGIEDVDLGPLNGVKENLLNGVKSLFEIQSPSKLMKREVGEYLGLGTLEGFVDGVSEIGDEAAEAFTNIPEIPLSFDEPELPELSDDITVSLAEEAAEILASIRNPQISPNVDPAALDLMLNSPAISASDMVQPSPTASITNNYTTNSTTNSANYATENAPSGDIIIPLQIGGESVETFVITAAQIANARSGGDTL